jgi:hypothetical protein
MISINNVEYRFPKGKIVYEITLSMATCENRSVEANSREEVMQAVDHWLFNTTTHNLKKFEDCLICRMQKQLDKGSI